MFTRRTFHKMAMAAAPLSLARAAKLNSIVDGVHLGVQTYSYRELPINEGIVDALIHAITRDGLSECELFAQQVEPPNIATNFWAGVDPKILGGGADGGPLSEQLRAKAKQQAVIKARDDLRRWRLEVPLDHFREVRKKFDAAGIQIHVYNLSFDNSFTDPEIDRVFEHAKALGVNIISASTQQSAAKRVAPFADKHKIVVSLHNHANLADADEFASPASFDRGLALSKYFKINLDIGHFTAANFDAVAFIKERHADITHLHLKDRKKNGGPNEEWGHGDTPIKEVLQLLATQRFAIPAYVEYEYPGKLGCVEEVQKCVDFVKRALAS